MKTSLALRTAGVVWLLAFSWRVMGQDKWPAPAPEEFTSARPALDPEAGAEILFYEVSMDEGGLDAFWTHTVRARILDERGIKHFAKIEILHDRNAYIRQIEARTSRADGTSTTLERSEIFTRDLVKFQNSGLKVTSFAPPGLEPGVIVEYRYRETRTRKSYFWPLAFQRDLPVRFARFKLKPGLLYATGVSLRCLTFNLPPFSLVADPGGFYTFEATDLPAWKNEPMQPPPLATQRSVIVYYTTANASSPAVYWKNASAELHRRMESSARVTRKVKAYAASLTVPGDSIADKVAKLHDHCRSQLSNASRDTTLLSPEQRKKLGPGRNVDDVIKYAMGTADDIVIAFVALARAAGLDARLAQANDRTVIFYSETLTEPFVFTKLVAAVRDGDSWIFCDPSSRYLPAGLLEWKHCGTSALVADAKEALIVPVELPPAHLSRTHRVGTFVLLDDGTIEGKVIEKATGFAELAAKNLLDARSPEERKSLLLSSVQRQMPEAELTALTVENADSPAAPLAITYLLRVPRFAERTGTRLFFQPAVLRKGIPPLFESPHRTRGVLFNHLYEELDEYEISLPAGFSLEAASAPGGLDLGKRGRFAIKLGYLEKNRTIHYTRDFAWGIVGGGVAHYATIKQVFDLVHGQDNHALTLKRDESAPSKPGE